MISPSPQLLARSQIARDRRQLARYPRLLPHKIERMQASPLAFLRGAAPLFYTVLKENRALLPPLPGRGWIAGDLHLENFGAFRPGGFDADHVAYGPNDFDDAAVGPWAFDALRLATSTLLAARSSLAGPRALKLAEALLDAHAGGLSGAPTPAPPRLVRELLERVAGRKRLELLDRFTEKGKGGRRLRRGPHFHDLPRPIEAAARKAFAAYVASIPPDDRPPAEAVVVEDLAFRVAGTGSLGMLRVAVLVAGKGGPDGGWLFDMKEQGTPSPALLLGRPALQPAERVLAALRACLEHPPRLAGTTRLGGRSLLVRRLAPQEDRVDLAKASPADLEEVVIFLGALAGAAHRRGATTRAAAWTRAQRARLLDGAIALAGLHEATYLSFLRETA
ncbi:MAG TPA: DUF2252 family protein [Myxococcales bacterium]|nr:DUF2252 family protein [Myxococcales bacterium]